MSLQFSLSNKHRRLSSFLSFFFFKIFFCFCFLVVWLVFCFFFYRFDLFRFFTLPKILEKSNEKPFFLDFDIWFF